MKVKGEMSSLYSNSAMNSRFLQTGSHSSNLHIGKNFSDFQVLKMLNESNFPILLVYSKLNQKHSIMKVFPYVNNAVDPSFEKEARFAQLSHSNIIKVLFAENQKQIIKNNRELKFSYIVMEFAPFGDFYDLITQGSLPQDEILARTFFHQLIEGVEYIHSQGIAHLDLKLDNLLMGEDYQLKITDFGCSKAEKDEINGQGTKGYRAPELRRQNCVNPYAADMYSVGIILFALRFQCCPYSEDNLTQGRNLEKMIREGDRSFWEVLKSISPGHFECSEDFKSLFMSLTRWDPNSRATIEEVKRSRWYNGPVYSKKKLIHIMKSSISPSNIHNKEESSCKIF